MPNNGKYSFSKVDCYNQCPFKFLLKYVDNKYVDVKAIALKVGTLIHDTEEAIANSIKENRPIDYVGLKNKVLLKMLELEHDFPEDFKEADKAGRYYKEKFYFYLDKGIYRLEAYCKEHPELELVGAEIPFNFTFCGKPFNGKIDRLFRNKETGKYLCQDIKTYPKAVDQDDLATPLQFVVYTEAIKEMYNVDGEDIQCQFDLPFCDIAQDAGTAGFVGRGIKKITKLLEGIDKDEYAPNPTPLCAWCEYSATNPNVRKENQLCPFHSMWTKTKKDFSHAAEWPGLEEYRNYCKKSEEEVV